MRFLPVTGVTGSIVRAGLIRSQGLSRLWRPTCDLVWTNPGQVRRPVGNIPGGWIIPSSINPHSTVGKKVARADFGPARWNGKNGPGADYSTGDRPFPRR